jgi:hypothetical protein
MECLGIPTIAVIVFSLDALSAFCGASPVVEVSLLSILFLKVKPFFITEERRIYVDTKCLAKGNFLL